MNHLSSRDRIAFALRFLALLLILTPLAAHFGAPLATALLPAVKTELAWLDENYRIIDLQVRQQGSDTTVWLQVSQAHAIVIGERVFLPDPRGRATASTLLASAAVPIVLILGCVMAAPLRQANTSAILAAKLGLYRALSAGVACLIVLAIDLPFTLWAAIWTIHVDAVQPDHFSPLLIWQDLLNGGGRQALGLALGLTIAWLTMDRRTYA
jgi:hypothetical protein